MHSVFNNSLVDMIDSCIAKADCNGEKSLPKIRKYTAAPKQAIKGGAKYAVKYHFKFLLVYYL